MTRFSARVVYWALRNDRHICILRGLAFSVAVIAPLDYVLRHIREYSAALIVTWDFKLFIRIIPPQRTRHGKVTPYFPLRGLNF